MGFTYRSKLSGGAASSSVSSGVIEANHTIRAIPAATITITNATNATPIVVTAVAHGLVTGDAISISGITGNTNANGYFKITKLSADTFSLQNYSTGADIAGNGAYGGTPVAVTGIVQSNRVLVGDGTAAMPSITLASEPGTGWYRSGPGAMTWGTAGAGYIKLDGYINISGASGITFLNGGGVGGAINNILTTGGAATLQLGAANSATHAGVAQTLQVQSNITETDQNAPASFTIIGPRGTGTGTPGTILFQVGTKQNTGGTAHVPATALTLQNVGTAGTAAPQAIFADGLAATPGIAFSGGTNSGIYNNAAAGAGTFIGNKAAWMIGFDADNAKVKMAGTTGFGWVAATTEASSPDTMLTRGGAAATLQLGAANAASPVAQTIQVQSARGGTDTNVAGPAWTQQGAIQTGNAVSGPININGGALSASSGTTAATSVLRRGTNWTKVLTNNSAIPVVNVTNASNTVAAGLVGYAVEVFNGTDLQVEVGEVSVMVTNKAGAWSGNTATKHGNIQNMSSGTLSVTWAITGANPAVLSVNANSSLTPSTGYPRVTYFYENLTQQAVAMR